MRGGGRPSGGVRLQLNARLVREKDRARARELRRLALYGAVIVVPLLVYVWQRVDFIRISYRAEALSRQRQDLQERNKQLTIERSLLLAPDRIERVARRQLGLVDPSPSDVKRVQVIDGQVSEVGATLAGARRPGPDRSQAAGGSEDRDAGGAVDGSGNGFVEAAALGAPQPPAPEKRR